MDAAACSLELLSHFDGPAARELERIKPSRGIAWVLQRSAAVAILLIAGCLLTQFGYCLAAELALARAARAGALEATLPRASYESVRQSAERRLENCPQWPTHRLRLSLLQNGASVRGTIQAGEGDWFAVTLSLPTHDVVPQWLGTACFWRADSWINAGAERQMPGRKILRR